MKRIFLTAIAVILLVGSQEVHAQKSIKLRSQQGHAPASASNPTLQLNELRSLLQKANLNAKEQSIALQSLDKLSADVSSNMVVFIKDMLELSLLYSKHDPSEEIYGLVYSLESSHPDDFKRALDQLSSNDARVIKRFLEIAKSVEKDGGQ